MVGGGDLFDLEPRARRSALSLAPLIDATFILLIFFMLVSQFGRQVPVDLAVSKASVQPQTQLTEPRAGIRAELGLHADGSFMINGNHFGASIGLEGAIDRIDQSLSQSHIATGSTPGLKAVVLKPDPDVQLQPLIDALMALKARPGLAVSILAPKSAPE